MDHFYLYLAVPSSAPINVTVTQTSTRSISIWWQPVPLRDRNGVILKYKITYYSSKWMHENSLQVDGSKTTAILDKLIPFTTYNITITAATVIGYGPISNSIFANTSQSCKFIIY